MKHNTLASLLCAATLSLAACSNDDLPTQDIPSENQTTTTVTFRMGVASNGQSNNVGSRVAHEEGLEGESQVNNAMILIYDRPLNSTVPGKVVKVIYIANPGTPTTSSNENFDAEYFISYYPYSDILNTIKVGDVTVEALYNESMKVDLSELEVGTRYYAIALANFGDMTSTFKGMTVSQLRDYVYTGDQYTVSTYTGTKSGDDFTDGIKHYSNFKMTGVNEVSFIRTKQNSDLNLTLSNPFLMQRLAARLDVSFGTYQTDFNFKDGTGEPVLTVHKVDESTISGATFTLTDIEVINSRTTASGIYLFERSSVNANGLPTVYLGNEGWDDNDNTFANNYVFCAPNATFYNTAPSVIKNGYENLGTLIESGNCGYTHSIISYLNEYTGVNTTNATRIKIKGTLAGASTAEIFQRPSRADETYQVSAELPIRHSIPTLGGHATNPMEYGIVRNTIYRIKIKVYAVDNKIEFRYYYYTGSNSNLEEEDYSATNFTTTVGENNNPGTPND